ncbi:uncharacterized protein [Prorops nasuta]|uniref:uncharacterized protein n=1 Tax=Prorops nasuta TaxID=863751 RepID=UPI0034CDBF6F
MCDHCSKVTTQKGYSGQVTCKCEHGDKKIDEAGSKDHGGCCSKKEKKAEGGCCGSSCCSGVKDVTGGCCSPPGSKDKNSCCPTGK